MCRLLTMAQRVVAVGADADLVYTGLVSQAILIIRTDKTTIFIFYARHKVRAASYSVMTTGWIAQPIHAVIVQFCALYIHTTCEEMCAFSYTDFALQTVKVSTICYLNK